jgi:hypothetical protein
MHSLKPFWRYYGGKWRAAPRYPEPRHDTIVEPFAGAAGYSLRYPSRRIVLVDKSPIIAGIWRYLIAATPEEIRRLPDIPEGGTVDDMDAPQEARWLAGFWCNDGAAAPCKRPSKWARHFGVGGIGENPSVWSGWTVRARDRVASQVAAINHWTIIEGDYADAPEIEGTWFVDPPYSTPAGRYYREQPADFAALGTWCRTRRGQVIVCEQEGADWLAFRPFARLKTTIGTRRSSEVVWTSTPPRQGELF